MKNHIEAPRALARKLYPAPGRCGWNPGKCPAMLLSMKRDICLYLYLLTLFLPSTMEVPKKRKRDVDCPRITYDTSSKVFDRLFKEESLEEMKDAVRKKLGLSSSFPVHLSQLRDGKQIVLEDDDDFDAFCASIHLTAVAQIKVYLGDDQLNSAGPDAVSTGGPKQLLGLSTVHDAAADDHSHSKKRKVTFVESSSQPVGDDVEEPHSSQFLLNSEPPPEASATLDTITAEGDNVEEPHSTLPNSEPPPEAPATLNVISADGDGTHETTDKTMKKQTGNTMKRKRKGKDDDPISEEQSLGEKLQSDVAVVTRKGQELQRYTSSIGDVDPPGANVSTRPPKETKKNQVRMEVVIVGKESNAALSTPNSTIVVKRAKKQDPKSPASTSALQTIPSVSKGKMKKSGQSQHLTMPAKSTPRKTLSKKSRKTEAPVEPPEAGDKDQALRSSATRAAVDAILGKFLSNNDSRETAITSLVDNTAPPPSIAPVKSNPSPEDQPVPPNDTNSITEQFKTTSKCPVCDKTPTHFRSRCPIIKAGIIAMRKRIAELEQCMPDDNNEERETVIEELRRIIDKRTKRNQTRARENKSTNVISMADKSVISPTLAADSSSVIEPPKTSQTVTPSKAPSLEDEPEVHDESFPSQGRILNSEVQDEGGEEEEEEASPFMRSIIPLPTRSASELLNEDGSSRSEDLQGDTSFREVNDLGSSMEVDKTGDAAVNDAYALDFAHLSALKPSENGQKLVKTASDKAPQSDPIETSEKPESSSPQSPIVSIEDDIHPPQSTPKADVAGRMRSQRISSRLVRKPTGLTFKPQNVASRSINGIRKNSRSTMRTGGLSRITDLPIPIICDTNLRSDRPKRWPSYIESSDNEAVHRKEMFDEEHQQVARSDRRRVVKRTYVESSDSGAVHPKEMFDEEHEDHQQVARSDRRRVVKRTYVESSDSEAVHPKEMSDEEHEDHQQAARAGEVEEADKQGRTDASEAKLRAKTPAKVPVPSNTKRNAEQSLASWAVFEGNSLAEDGSLGMVDELRYSSNTQSPVSPAVVNGVSKELGPLFLHSESQQSFPYSQYPNGLGEPPDSEDEENEVQAFVVKPQTSTKNSSKFRSLTEIASQPTLFTPTMHLTRDTNSTKEGVVNLYGRAMKAQEEEESSSDSDSESESDAGTKAQTSHIPISRRAGTLTK